MDFSRVIEKVCAQLDDAAIRYALIGDYLEIFDLGDRQQTMKDWYDQAQ